MLHGARARRVCCLAPRSRGPSRPSAQVLDMLLPRRTVLIALAAAPLALDVAIAQQPPIAVRRRSIAGRVAVLAQLASAASASAINGTMQPIASEGRLPM